MNKEQRLNLGILLVILVLEIVSFSRRNPSSPESIKISEGSNAPQLFMDSRGLVVDPYSQRQVKNTMTANAKDIQDCFNSYVDRNPKDAAKGIVFLDWMVSPNGKASRVRLVASDFSEKKFHECLMKAIEDWEFPEPASSTYAEHRFSFSKGPESSATTK